MTSGSSNAFIKGLVSTIIPVFNRQEMVIIAIQSVLEQTYQNLEIILVDDGSTDKTAQVCQAYCHENPNLYKFVSISNSGPGPAREAGRQLAAGEFIQYLDSDDILTPNKFTDQVSLLNSHPDVDIAYGITNLVDLNGAIMKSGFKWTTKDYSFIFPFLLVDRWWCTHTPLYRRTLTDRMGAWSNLRWSQDWEYDARAGALNAKIKSCNSHVSNHVHHDNMRQTNKADFYGDPIRLKNRAALLTALWKNYLLSGTTSHGQEVAHFSRWAFLIARSAAYLNLKQEALTMLEIAKEADNLAKVKSVLIPLFQQSTNLLGTSMTGKLFHLAQKIKPGRSQNSHKQAFED